MRVTDKNYYMENKLIEKLDVMIKRTTGNNKQDNLIIIDGDEGFGKSTLGVAIAYYVSNKTGREFPADCSNLFFNPEKFIDFVKSTEEKIIVWDEAALGGLSIQWNTEIQKQLTQLLMVCRKKRHFIIFNIPKFFKLNEYLLVDRAIALIHVYGRNEIELGRFCYFKKKSKEKLFYDRIRKRERNYKKFYDFHGTFPNILDKIIDEDIYDEKKDRAIMSIGTKEKNVFKDKLIELQNRIVSSGQDIKFLSEILNIPERTLYNWRKKVENADKSGVLPPA